MERCIAAPDILRFKFDTLRRGNTSGCHWSFGHLLAESRAGDEDTGTTGNETCNLSLLPTGRIELKFEV